jgi:hypothetical protein
MLQKIVNGIAIASGIVSLTVVGTAGYLYLNKDAILENVKSKVMESVLPGGLGALSGAAGLGLPSPSTPVPDASAPESPSIPPISF